MSHKLNDITLYYNPSGELARKFTGRQNMVSGLYVHYLGGYKPKGTSRISISLEDNDNTGFYFGSILSPRARFDKEEYWSKSPQEQNRIILETVHRLALLCAEKYEWDKEVFIKAYSKVLQSNFVYSVEYKRKLSKNKKYQATIVLEKDEICASIFVLFVDKDGNYQNKVKLLDTWHWENYYSEIVKGAKWLGHDTFGYTSPSNQITFQAKIGSHKGDIILSPLKDSIDTLIRKVDGLLYREIKGPQDMEIVMGYQKEKLENLGIIVDGNKFYYINN